MNIARDLSKKYFLSSVTRITDLNRNSFEVKKLPRNKWQMADYVVGEVTGYQTSIYQVELSNGRMVQLTQGDLIIGAFGKRAATLEGTGDWEAIKEDGEMNALTSAGLFGKKISLSVYSKPMTNLKYKGHLIRHDKKLNMSDFIKPVAKAKLDAKVIMLIGTSMSAGKTTTGRVIIQELKKAGKKVIAAKLTGASRRRDILAFEDAGADKIIDFVDAGLPSTVVPPANFRIALTYLISCIAQHQPDFVVVEVGASPLEPYNGDLVVEYLKNNISLLILSASDPYSVLGVQKAFKVEPNFVTGPAANTKAGIELVKSLTGLEALNIERLSSLTRLHEILKEHVDSSLDFG